MAPICSRPTRWLLGLLGAALVLSWYDVPALRYERAAILSGGDYWRLLTAHFTHLNAAHLLLNLAGLGLVGVLFPHQYSVRQWLVILCASIIAIDVGFVFLTPQLDWYAGFSGVLHGALAAGALAWWRSESRLLAAVLSVFLVGKLAWEQTQGALPLSGDMPVVVDAHLYGAVGGMLGAGTLWLRDQVWPRAQASL